MKRQWSNPEINNLRYVKTRNGVYDGKPCCGRGPAGNSTTCPVLTSVSASGAYDYCEYASDGNKPNHDKGRVICTAPRGGDTPENPS